MLIEEHLKTIIKDGRVEFFGTITFTKEAMEVFVKAFEREEHG